MTRDLWHQVKGQVTAILQRLHPVGQSPSNKCSVKIATVQVAYTSQCVSITAFTPATWEHSKAILQLLYLQQVQEPFRHLTVNWVARSLPAFGQAYCHRYMPDAPTPTCHSWPISCCHNPLNCNASGRCLRAASAAVQAVAANQAATALTQPTSPP